MGKPEMQSGVLGLSGDLNQKLNPFIVNSDMYRLQGMYYSEMAALSKRLGLRKLNSLKYTVWDEANQEDFPQSFFWLYEANYSSKSSAILAMTQTGIATFATSEWVQGNMKVAFNTGLRDTIFYGTMYDDIVYVHNGLTYFPMWVDAGGQQGATAYRMGIAAPTVKPSTSVHDHGAEPALSNGTYSYKYTFIGMRGNESNPSPVSDDVVITGANGHVVLTVPVSTDAQVVARNIYRTAVDGGTWFLLDTIEDNEVTYFHDDFPDTTLTFQIEEFANGVPPSWTGIAFYKDHAFMVGDPSNPSYVWFSYPGIPDAVNAVDFRDIDANDGFRCTAVASFQNMIVAFKQNSIWNGMGDDRETFMFDRRVNNVGSVNQHSVIEIPGKSVLAFFSPERRIYFYDGTHAVYASAAIEPILQRAIASRLTKIQAVLVPKLNQVRWLIPTTADGDHTLIVWYDYVQDKWGTTELSYETRVGYIATMKSASGLLSMFGGQSYNSERWFIDFWVGDGGWVWEFDYGGTDDGTTYTVLVGDRGHPLGDPLPENNKLYSHLFVWYKPTPGVMLDVYCYINDPESTPIYLGQIDCSHASGQEHLHFNRVARRLYFEFRETSKLSGLVLRGWKCYFKDIGQHHAP